MPNINEKDPVRRQTAPPEPPTRIERLRDSVQHASRGGVMNSEDLADMAALLDELYEAEKAAKATAPKTRKAKD